MEKSWYTEEWIIVILSQHEAVAKTADLCHEQGISAATFCALELIFGGTKCERGVAAAAEDGGREPRPKQPWRT